MGPKSRDRKSKSIAKPPASKSAETKSYVAVELQQLILNCFSKAFTVDADSTLAHKIQLVKGHLFQRDFLSAFGEENLRSAYVARWSPSRALAYTTVFSDLPVLQDNVSFTSEPNSITSSDPIRVFCIGGGAGAEVAAFAAVCNTLLSWSLEIFVVDVAEWSNCLDRLKISVTETPPISPYASEAARTANKPLINNPERFKVSFRRQNVLSMTEEQVSQAMAGTKLVTIMFTLNELFSASMARTTAFLLTLTDAAEPGSWLLIVDSPGSYSEVTLGRQRTDADEKHEEKATKQYPMKWLVDHTLLNVAAGVRRGTDVDHNQKTPKWEKKVENDSQWFRMDPTLKYPIELENMRYQIHLYQRLGSTVSSGADVGADVAAGAGETGASDV